MAENEHFFTPESVDEQVEQLSAQQSNKVPPQDEASKYLVKDLQRAYHTQAEQRQQTLDRAWQRIQERKRLTESPTQTLPIIPSAPRPTRRRTGWLYSQQFNMVAAVLVTCLLVGSLLVVLNMAQHGKSPASTTRPTPTSTAISTQTVPAKPGDTLFTHQDSSAIYSVDWSPDGTLLASASKTVQIWDARTGQHKSTLTPQQVNGPFAARWSPDGKFIAAATPGLQIWNIATSNLAHSCPDPMQQAVVSTIPTAFFSVVSSSSALQRASASSGSVSNKDQVPVNVAWSPDGKQVAFTYRNPAGPMVVVQNIATCKIVETYHHLDTPFDIKWSPDGKYLAVSTSDRAVQVLQPGKDDPAYTYHDPHQTDIFSIAWSPDSKSIASSSYGSQRVLVWSALSGKLEHEYVSPTGPITRLAWSRDGSKIASASESADEEGGSGKVQVWNVKAEQVLYTYPGHTRPVLALAWSPDGKWIASADGDPAASSSVMGNGTLKVWQVQ